MDSDIPDPSFLRFLQNHRFSINWLAFSPNSNYVVTASDDKNVALCCPKDKNNICYKYTGHSDSVTSVAMTNSYIVSGSKDCTARIWRLGDVDEELCHSSESNVYRCHQSPIRSVDINGDGSLFCTSSDDKTIKIWSSTATNKCISLLNGEHTNWIRHARFSKLNPNLLTSCGDDGLICIWDIRCKAGQSKSNEAAIKLTTKPRPTHFYSVQWHPNAENIISSTSTDSSIRIWDLRSEKTLQSYQVHDGFVTSADFHSSGNYLLSSSLDQTCKIIDIYEGRPLLTLRAHVGAVNCAQFSPDGNHFVTAGQDRTAIYWKSNLPNGFAAYDQNDCSDEEENRTNDSYEERRPVSQKLIDHNRVKNIAREIEQTNVKREQCEAQLANDSNDSLESSHSYDENGHCISILKSILGQLEVITDSILNIDQRLSTLENQHQRNSTS